MKSLFGFSLSELTSWKSLIILLHQPRHASILAFTRIAFGFLMLIDIPQERGMTRTDDSYGEYSKEFCRFPLFDSLQPLPVDFMVILYAVLFLSALGIMLGCFYRFSCLVFTLIYWYFFFLDKSKWNNHSYLYGLLGFIFLITDAHRYASVDGMFRKGINNSHVPLWNYTLLRFQIFLVYFYAGLKKTELDWLMGYSMQKLTRHWIFNPMRYFLDEASMDLLLVHYGGFTLDLSAGFLLFFDQTRYLGFILCASFHLMNSQLFSIGMFPYAMLATMFVFCPHSSFKDFVEKMFRHQGTSPTRKNDNCFYESKPKPPSAANKITWKHCFTTLLTVCYITEQLFLPYSHFITKGYNGWTEGPYGYTWDMMVHSFHSQHIKITFVDKHGKEGYLKPGAFLRPSRGRWSAHPDMIIQYARCLRKKLVEMDVEEPAIYIDIWKSLNGRFQQRMVDPRIDLASYEWSPFKTPEFILPVLTDLSSWRVKLQEIRKKYKNHTLHVVFVADFPGMMLENYLQEDYRNTSIEVLSGKILVQDQSHQINTTLSQGDRVKVPGGKFHNVQTISTSPSCYVYIYHNVTDQSIQERVEEYRRKISTSEREFWSSSSNTEDDPLVIDLYMKEEAKKKIKNRGWYVITCRFILNKLAIFRRSFLLATYSARNVAFGKPMSQQLLEEKEYIDSWFSSMYSLLGLQINEEQTILNQHKDNC